MSDSGSESDSDSLCSDAEKVAEALEDYEQEKRLRKKRYDALSEKREVILTKEALSNLVLTKKQIAQLKRDQKEKDSIEKRERTEKQKQQIAELNARKRVQIDLRKSKEDEGITLKINKSQIRKKPSEKAPIKVKEVLVSDDDEPPKRFQGKKPDLDELEEKVQKLNIINKVIETQNPYLAMILKNRR